MMVTNFSDTTTRAKALATTISVHVLLLLLLLLLKFNMPVLNTPTAEELGMEVNLGTDDNGSGEDQPMAISEPTAEKNNKQYQASSQQVEGMKDMERSDDPDAPAIGPVNSKENVRVKPNIQNENKRKTSEQQPTDNNQRRPQHVKYSYPGSNGQGGNTAMNDVTGTNEGNTTGPGDRGVPGGNPGAANYEGSPGNGTGGINHNLTGRQIFPSRFEAAFREGGRVKVQVTVDGAGNIISKRVVSSPNPVLSRIALEKLDQAKFSESSAPEQIGVVTIVFKARS